MSQHAPWLRPSLLAAAALLSLSAQAASLVGFASMPAETYAHGPTAGQFVSGANGLALPLVDKQPVQGFSAVLFGKQAGTFDVMPDNGFGNRGNSPDALLRMYTLRPEFRTWDGSQRVGAGSITPVQRKTGETRPSFDRESAITLHDPDHLLGYTLVADQVTYPYIGSGPGSADIPVDKSIRKRSLLTGGDLDIESVRRDKNGHLWFGDEFGPFLVKTDNQGKVLRAEVPMAGVMSPSNPYLNGATPTLNNSNGFEGMAISPDGGTLYTLLEGTVVGDAPKSLRINAFSVDSEAYTGQQWLYKLDAAGTNIGDMTAVNDHQFLVIERNGTEAVRFKKIFLIDLSVVDAEGYVAKTEVADLMNLADPHDLNLDGKDVFTFPFVTIEDVLVLSADTILVMNDNNYPGSSRDAGVPDPNEFLKIKLDQPLDFDAKLLRR